MNIDRDEVIGSLLQASPDAVIVADSAGRIESASAPVERLFGYHPSELVGQPVEVLVPRELRQVHESHRTRYAAHPGARAMGSGLALYGRRRDGSTFPVDVSLAPIEVDGDRLVGAFIRDATDRRRGEDVLRHVNEISRHLLAGEATRETLRLIAQRARGLVGATAAWVVIPSRGDALLVEAADGDGTDDLLGATVSATESLSARTMASGEPLWVSDMATDPNVVPAGRSLGLGPGIYLPMLANEDVVGVLVVGRATDADPFDPQEAQALQVFASAASIVLSLGRAREELDSLRIVSEHERIARDLHDTVIQRLFAVGMSLQGSTRLAQGVVAERIDESVDAIDEVIREIRQTIFELNNPAAGSGGGIRGQLQETALASAAQLGFQPRLAFNGDLDMAVSAELAQHLISVAREGLSNVARHARATSVDVVLSAESGTVCLSVTDDGIGMPDGPTAGQGLGNLRSRAEQLGGWFRVADRRPNGTIIEWTVPARR